MNLKTFFTKVEKDDLINGVSIDNDEIILENPNINLKMRFSIDTIKSHKWEEIRDIMTAKSNPISIEHVTRVVGYFSRTANWNKSKLAELEDRRKGRYVMTGVENG